MLRAKIVDDATLLYERFVAFALDALSGEEERHRRFVATMATHGREDLRFAPRDGETPAEVDDMITHWFGILNTWMDDPAGAAGDPEAVSMWVGEWPRGLVRELLFVGLRSPDGIDQEAYELAQLLPAAATVRIEISPTELEVSVEAPEFETISLRRYAGSDNGMAMPLNLALGSANAALRARERGENIS